MKKHDEKKQGTTGSVSSRNCVKERKAKQTQQETPKEIRQKHAAERNRIICYGKNDMGTKEDKRKR